MPVSDVTVMVTVAVETVPGSSGNGIRQVSTDAPEHVIVDLGHSLRIHRVRRMAAHDEKDHKKENDPRGGPSTHFGTTNEFA